MKSFWKILSFFTIDWFITVPVFFLGGLDPIEDIQDFFIKIFGSRFVFYLMHFFNVLIPTLIVYFLNKKTNYLTRNQFVVTQSLFIISYVLLLWWLLGSLARAFSNMTFSLL